MKKKVNTASKGGPIAELIKAWMFAPHSKYNKEREKCPPSNRPPKCISKGQSGKKATMGVKE